jgi:hypothetical protein
MNAKTLVPVLVLGALLLAGCTRPQESGDNASTTTCPSDLNNASTENESAEYGNGTYGATDETANANDACADMEAPTPGSGSEMPGNETNETNTTI